MFVDPLPSCESSEIGCESMMMDKISFFSRFTRGGSVLPAHPGLAVSVLLFYVLLSFLSLSLRFLSLPPVVPIRKHNITVFVRLCSSCSPWPQKNSLPLSFICVVCLFLFVFHTVSFLEVRKRNINVFVNLCFSCPP